MRKRKRELEMLGEGSEGLSLSGYCLDTVPLMLH